MPRADTLFDLVALAGLCGIAAAAWMVAPALGVFVGSVEMFVVGCTGSAIYQSATRGRDSGLSSVDLEDGAPRPQGRLAAALAAVTRRDRREQ